MDDRRRTLLSSAGAAAALLAGGLLKPILALAAAWNKDAFAAKNPADALKPVPTNSTRRQKARYRHTTLEKSPTPMWSAGSEA